MGKSQSTLFSLLLAFVAALFAALSVWWFIHTFLLANPNVQSAIIAGVASLLIALYNTKKMRQQAAFEAHKEIKAKIYDDFISKMVSLFQPDTRERHSENALLEFMANFSSKIMMYGSPQVLQSFISWRESANEKDVRKMLEKTGALILAMRADLGESNAGLDPLDLLAPLIKGGRAALEQELGDV